MSEIENKIKLWWNIIRPKTLFASICPVVIGYLMVDKKHYCIEKQWLYFFIILLCSVSLQVLSNLINDYYDYKKGTDKKGRIGFKRALAEGTVSLNQMQKTIYITLIIVLITGLILIITGGLPILLIGITAILFAWLYTATTFSLSYLGIADIFCFLYYGLFAVAGTYYILDKHQISDIPNSVYYVGAVCGLISMSVLMINNVRDIEDDRMAKKKTLPVRLGKKICEYILLIYSLLMLVLTFLAFGLSFTNLIFIPAFMLYQQVASAQPNQYNKYLFKAGLLNLFFVFLLFLEVML